MLQGSKLDSIQFLRAVAACMVVVGHALTESLQLAGGDTVGVSQVWQYGVDVFFVISGFIMVITNYNLFGEARSFPLFIKKRIIRIVPTYWLFTILMVLAILVFPTQLNKAKFDLAHVISSFLFLPFPNPAGGDHPVLSLGWTLNYEMFFYALFSAFIVFPRRLGLSLMAVVLCLLPLAGMYLDMDSLPFSFWTNSIILEFLFGMLIGVVFKQYGAIFDRLIFVAVLVAALAIFLVSVGLPRFMHAGVPAALVVLAFALYTPINDLAFIRVIGRWIGDSSFSLYLSHPFSLAIAKVVWVHTVGVGHFSAYAVFGFFAALVGGLASYWLIEKPSVELLSRHLIKSRPPRAA
jgi:peptidoglycan/LPS O-acetylase OafA/YrhL